MVNSSSTGHSSTWVTQDKNLRHLHTSSFRVTHTAPLLKTSNTWSLLIGHSSSRRINGTQGIVELSDNGPWTSDVEPMILLQSRAANLVLISLTVVEMMTHSTGIGKVRMMKSSQVMLRMVLPMLSCVKRTMISLPMVLLSMVSVFGLSGIVQHQITYPLKPHGTM